MRMAKIFKNAYPRSNFSFFGDADVFIGGFTSQPDGIFWHSFNYKHHWRREEKRKNIYIMKEYIISLIIDKFAPNKSRRSFDVISQYSNVTTITQNVADVKWTLKQHCMLILGGLISAKEERYCVSVISRPVFFFK